MQVIYFRDHPRKHREGVQGQGRQESSCTELVCLPLWAAGVQSSTHLRSVPLRSEVAGVFVQLPRLTDGRCHVKHKLLGFWGLPCVWALHVPRPSREMQKVYRCIQECLQWSSGVGRGAVGGVPVTSPMLCISF